jgi:hypothetical protein
MDAISTYNSYTKWSLLRYEVPYHNRTDSPTHRYALCWDDNLLDLIGIPNDYPIRGLNNTDKEQICRRIESKFSAHNKNSLEKVEDKINNTTEFIYKIKYRTNTY